MNFDPPFGDQRSLMDVGQSWTPIMGSDESSLRADSHKDVWPLKFGRNFYDTDCYCQILSLSVAIINIPTKQHPSMFRHFGLFISLVTFNLTAWNCYLASAELSCYNNCRYSGSIWSLCSTHNLVKYCSLYVEEITTYLGVTRDSVYRWVVSKGLPCHRIGRLWKFRRTRSKNGSSRVALTTG